jgi:hypothetical protein
VLRPPVDSWLGQLDGAGALARSAAWTDNALALGAPIADDGLVRERSVAVDARQSALRAARLFAVPLPSGAVFTERYLAGSTQLDCLSEIF